MPELQPPTLDRPFAVIQSAPAEALADVDFALVDEAYRVHGAVLLRGFPADVDAFGQFAQSFCPVSVHNDSGNRLLLDGHKGVQSVNLGFRPFPLHPELSREPWKPDIAFFHCITPPSVGGQTTVCDGIAIVDALPPSTRDAMAERRIKYAVPTTEADLSFWLGNARPSEQALLQPQATCPFTFERHDGRLMRCFTRPLLHRTRFQQALAFGNFLLFARYLRGVKTYPLLDDMTPVPDEWVEAVKEVSDRLTAPVGWQAGDLLMVDNSRFMHGRTEVTPNDGRMIATYFGYLKDAAPDPEEPQDPPWRKPGFAPPQLANKVAPAS